MTNRVLTGLLRLSLPLFATACASPGVKAPSVVYVDREVIEAPPAYLMPRCDSPTPAAIALQTGASLLDAYLADAAALVSCAGQGAGLWLWGVQGATLNP